MYNGELFLARRTPTTSISFGMVQFEFFTIKMFALKAFALFQKAIDFLIKLLLAVDV